jgi:hypothetical protein
MLAKIALATLALAGAVSAAFSSGGLSILAPGGDGLWWRASFLFLFLFPFSSQGFLVEICVLPH